MTDTKVIIIRHGETKWNLEGRWQGHLDSSLTMNGHNQAKAIAKNLLDQNISTLYSSDLGRALQTAEQISKSTGIKITNDCRLRERHLGIFQGLTVSEMMEKFPDEYNRFRDQGPEYIVPDGESKKQCYERNILCINEIVQKHPGETLVIVAHGGVLDSVFRYVIGIPLEAPRTFIIWNAGMNTFSHSNGKWYLLTFGEINHLNSIRTIDDA